MSINGLLTKVIFDHNPKNEFFVEESFPLEWMYPYLTPFGIIMKINREKVPEITQEIVDRDHDFWKQFSTRLSGDFINYDTPVKEVTAWVEKTYLRRDFNGFQGDRRFIRDDQAQKAFSKLRSSIGGVYQWRLQHPQSNELTSPIQQRLIKEADFAFKQAFAFCPYSPEAVFRYVNLLTTLHRLDDAVMVAETSLRLDPYNGQFQDVAKSLKELRQRESAGAPQMPTIDLAPMQKAVRDNPADFQAAFNLASAYVQLEQTPKAIEVLEAVMNHPSANAMAFRSLSLAFADLQYTNGLKELAVKLEDEVKKNPNDSLARLGLSENYRRLHQTASAILALEPVLRNPHPDPSGLRMAATEYNELRDYGKLEQALEKLSQVSPEAPEVWYQLATLQAGLGKGSNAIASLRRAAEITTAVRKTNQSVPDVLDVARQDPKFAMLRTNAEFLQLTAPK
jgi:tetratricopeptide (TPR) repeat protein